MNRRLVIDLPAWQVAVAAGTAIICAAVVGAGLAWGGVEYGRATAPAPTSTERVYTTEDLQQAVTDCGIDGVQPTPEGALVIDASHPGFERECVLTWLEAPGPVMAAFRVDSTPEGETRDFAWSNVRASWVQKPDARDLTITIQET